jgi:hypothetical protein
MAIANKKIDLQTNKLPTKITKRTNLANTQDANEYAFTKYWFSGQNYKEWELNPRPQLC